MPEPSPELPPKPDSMDFGDCCGGGCAQCVLDEYYKALDVWRARVAEIQKQSVTSPSAEP